MINYNGYSGFQSGGLVKKKNPLVSGRTRGKYSTNREAVRTQQMLRDAAADQASRGGWFSGLKNLLGIGAGFAGSYFLPGLFSGAVSPLLKTLFYSAPKAVTEAIASKAYKAKDYSGDAIFGLDKFDELKARDQSISDMGLEQAGTGFLTDTLMAMINNPLTGERMGTMADRMGIQPKEWGQRVASGRPGFEETLKQNIFGAGNTLPGLQFDSGLKELQSSLGLLEQPTIGGFGQPPLMPGSQQELQSLQQAFTR